MDKHGVRDGLDTIPLTGDLVEQYIAEMTVGAVDTRNASDEFVIVSAAEIETAEASSDPLKVGSTTTALAGTATQCKR